jgi:ribose transport system substrate-binding protein
MHSRFVRLSAVAVCLFFLAGCHRETRRVIAVIPKGNVTQYWQSVHAGAVKAARELNVDIAWNGTASETDYSGQLQILDAMINRQVDALTFAPIDRKAMVGAVERAAREKIPVIIFDSAIDTDHFVSQVATDNYHAGEVAADRVGELLHGKGSVAMVKAVPGGVSTMAREAGFTHRLAASFPGIQVVAEQFGWADYAKSLAATENILTAHPDLNAIFASNESSTVGAARALEGRRTGVKLVGFDWTPVLENDLREGVVDSLVVQDPFRMGYETVKSALAHLNGQSVPKIQNLEPKLVNRDNMNTPEVALRIKPDLKKYLDFVQ